MKLQWQIIFGLMLIFAVLASMTVAQSQEEQQQDSGSNESAIDDDASNDAPIDDADSDESQAAENANVQQDYLNVVDYTRPPSPWWWN